MFKTTDGGRTWQSQLLPGQPHYASSVWCLDSNRCWAAGSAGPETVFRTTDGGDQWIASSLYSTGGGAKFVSCPTTTTCFGGGWVDTITGPNQVEPQPALLKSSDGGATWSVVDRYNTTDGGAFTGISCPSSQDCTAVGEHGGTTPLLVATDDGGQHWISESTPAGLQQLQSVSCTASTGCSSLGYMGSGTPTFSEVVVHSTGSGGTTEFTTTSESFSAISCVSAGPCWLAGSARGPSSPTGAIASDTP